MCQRYCIATVDRTLCSIMKSPHVPLRGNCVLFSGDFLQILPVVPRASRGMIVLMCFKSCPPYLCVKLLSLTENMSLQSIMNEHEIDKAFLEYPKFLLELDEGKVKRTIDSLIELPSAVNVVGAATELVQSVFENLDSKYYDIPWITSRAILTPPNSRLQSLNDQVAEWFLETFSVYKSADSVVCYSLKSQNAAEQIYPQELLNSIEVGASLLDHEISLKKGFIVMIL